MNAISFVGNLGADPEVIVGASGKKRVGFSVAVNEGQGDSEKTHWIRCTAFGTLAENMCDSLHKGTRVVVVGRFNTYTKEVGTDGEAKNLTMVGVTVSSLGPDLTWATAKVSRVVREGNGEAEEDDAKSSSSAKPAASSKASKAPVEEDDGF